MISDNNEKAGLEEVADLSLWCQDIIILKNSSKLRRSWLVLGEHNNIDVHTNVD